MKNKIVNFIPKDLNSYHYVPSLKSAKSYIPEWFKKMPLVLADLDNKKMDETAKKCPPFTDSFLMGYIQELPCDVSIKYLGYDDINDTDLIEYAWAGEFKPMSTREEDTRSRKVLPSFDGYYKKEFHWNTFWEPETPEGYSTLYMHPLNRYDLPFITMNGVIDTDKWSMSGPLPFLIKKGFEGIIPAGTPMYQVVFIKREPWVSNKKEYNLIHNKKMEHSIKKFFNGGYKKMYWSKKEYN